ncbi:MAG: hypothetical protein N3B13_07855 [Deltaproteobacteria bacterium]|nr:hypothetical protein [Deltaproteobacteria bacterium]
MRRLIVFALLVFVVISCDPGIGTDEMQSPVLSTFDREKGLIILPNDLLKNPETGRLALPETPADSELTKEIKGFINMLDGWLVAQTITIPFEYELDKTTVKPENVLLFDIDIANKSVVKKSAAEYYALYNFSMTPAEKPPFYITVKNKPNDESGGMPADFVQGHVYLVAVTNAVKTKDGKDITENPVYYFLKKKEPLINEAKKSVTVLSDEEALMLEPARDAYNKLFALVEKTDGSIREKSVAFSFFSIQSGSRALFNPASVGQILPQPNDIKGKANASPDVKPYIYYNLPLDETTLSKGVMMMKLTGGQPIPVEISKVEVIEEIKDGKSLYRLQIIPKNLLEKGSTYLVFTTNDIKSKHGVETSAYSTFSILRAKNPLITKVDNTNYVLNSPLIDSTLDVLILASKLGLLSDAAKKNIAAATSDDWKTAYGLLIQNLVNLEALRNAYTPLFNGIEAAGIPRKNITALWTFTTTAE